MQRIKTALAVTFFVLVGLTAVVGWLLLYQLALSSLGIENLWLWVIGLPLWVIAPIAAYTQLTQRRLDKKIRALELLAQEDPSGAFHQVHQMAISLTIGHSWRRVRDDLIPLMRLARPHLSPRLDELASHINQITTWGDPRKAHAARPGSGKPPLAELEDQALAALQSLGEGEGGGANIDAEGG